MSRCPFAEWAPIIGAPGGSFVTPPRLGIVHTFEARNADGSPSGVYRYNPARYGAGATPPHFTVSVTPGVVHQHIDTDWSAYALENRSDPGETNRAGLIQVELMWCAADIADAPQSLLDNFAQLAEWVEAEHPKVRCRFPLAFHTYPAEPGQFYGRESYRLDRHDFDVLEGGWIGHMHVVENSHGDPGLLPVDRIFVTAAPASVPAAPMVAHEYSEDSVHTQLVTVRPSGFVLASDPVDPGYGRPPVPVGLIPNGLVPLDVALGVEQHGNAIVVMGYPKTFDVDGHPQAAQQNPFDVWLSVA